jgi:hypothetical protein
MSGCLDVQASGRLVNLDAWTYPEIVNSPRADWCITKEAVSRFELSDQHLHLLKIPRRRCGVRLYWEVETLKRLFEPPLGWIPLEELAVRTHRTLISLSHLIDMGRLARTTRAAHLVCGDRGCRASHTSHTIHLLT